VDRMAKAGVGLRPRKKVSAYFGRPKLVNALASKSLFLLLRGRVESQRLLNRVRRRGELSPPSTDAARVELSSFLDAGYDRLNLGGGDKQLAGFVNVDFLRHPSVAREVVADLGDLSFVPSGCLSQVHSNHVFEHLEASSLSRLFSEIARILRPGGLLTFRGPNALGVCYGFFFGEELEGDRAGFVAAGFPPDEDFANPRDRWYHGDVFALVHWILGETGRVDNQHLQLLTPTACRRLLEEHGFEILRMSEPEASNIVVVARRP
jgi:SAM-dependent methyltransferase